MIEIKVLDSDPFVVEQKKFRQLKARDGEEEGGWRLDLVLQKSAKSRITDVGVSVRYFDQDADFLGLDTPYCTVGNIEMSNDIQDLSLYVEPPERAAYAELRIRTQKRFWKIICEDPRWYVPLFILTLLCLIAFGRLFG